MEKYYYVSDRITGVIFHSEENLKKYYKKATKKINSSRDLSEINCGRISMFETKSGLEEYVNRNRTHPNHIWKIA